MSGYGQTAREIDGYVNRKVGRLQQLYLNQDASARGTLARLRRLDTPGGGYWMMVGEQLFSNLPDWGRQEGMALLSIRTTLKLYALHQQSKCEGVAVMRTDDRLPSDSFGYACSCISSGPSGKGAEGVRRRMAGIEGAADLHGAEPFLRALVRLMRDATEPSSDGSAPGVPVRLDYGRLAADLFLIQVLERREGVFMRWARDYYSYKVWQD